VGESWLAAKRCQRRLAQQKSDRAEGKKGRGEQWTDGQIGLTEEGWKGPTNLMAKNVQFSGRQLV
jgi:hypothetical protein